MAEPLIHLEPTVLRQLEQIQQEEGKPLDAEALRRRLSRRKGRLGGNEPIVLEGADALFQSRRFGWVRTCLRLTSTQWRCF
jgi:hypothetical protein